MKTIFIGTNGLRAGWRFAIYLAIFVPLGLGLDWFVTHVLHYSYSAGWNAPDFIVDGASSLSVTAFAAWMMSKLEHRPFAEYGLTRRVAFGWQFWLGLLWGLIPSILIVVMIWALGGATFQGLAVHGRALFSSALFWGLAFLLLGFSEEFLYRGYAQFTLSTGMGFWPAAALLSAVFSAVHYFGKPMESWRDGVSVALYGLFWCFTLRRTGSLWFAIGFHAMSDYADMVIFAEPNTGNQGQPLPGHLLNITYHGPDWLTGGPCGTEASALVFLILAALFLLFHRLYPPRVPPHTP